MRNVARVLVVLTFAIVAAGLSAAQESREIRKTVSLSADGQVSVDTYKGSVKIETWEKAEVDIYARIEADDWGRYDEEKVRDTEIDIDASASSVRIKTDYSRVNQRHSFWGLFDGETGNLPFVHYVIKMPSQAKLRIKDYKSDIIVGSLKSQVDINTYKGNVDINGLEGSLDLETYKGECRVDFAKLKSSSSFETYKGEIRLRLPSETSFTLDANVGRRGDLDSDFEYRTSTSRWSRRDQWYRGDINGGGPTVRLRTEKGTFRLAKQ